MIPLSIFYPLFLSFLLNIRANLFKIKNKLLTNRELGRVLCYDKMKAYNKAREIILILYLI